LNTVSKTKYRLQLRKYT